MSGKTDLEAERYLARSMSIFESHQTTQGLARAHTAAASIAFTQQKIDEATRHAELGAKYAGQLDDRFTLAKNDWVWGKILSSRATGKRQARSSSRRERRSKSRRRHTSWRG